MNNAIYSILGGVVGCGIGILSTRKYYKKRYSAYAEKQISDVRKSFKEHADTIARKVDSILNNVDGTYDPTAHTAVDKDFVESMARKEHYVSSDDEYDTSNSGIAYIPPEEYGEDVEYCLVSLTYYTDGVIADDYNDEKIDDFAELIGEDFDAHFGDFEDDAVFIKNTDTQCYYEVARSLKAYSEIQEESLS